MAAGATMSPPRQNPPCLPVLREDLSLHPGPSTAEGAPTWTIADPARNRHFRLSWPAFEILTRWEAGSAEAIAAAVNAQTPLTIAPSAVGEVADFLVGNQLVRPAGPQDSRRLAALAEAQGQSWLQWLLHHYLFFRVPLLRPDAWLGRTLPAVRWLGSPWFRRASVAALLLGLLLLQRQWEGFVGALVDTVSWSGLASYGVALALVKMVHEAAHAYTAKHYGCRVPTMGIAFLVLWPMLYTDVNETWTLPERRRRLWVGAAGVTAELTVAAWATLAWTFLPDGPLRQGAFVLAAVTWISSLVLNLSPFMRFDGYFLLMDGLEMPNLHPRAFAMARWWLREALFALGHPAPEPMPPARRRLLVAFAILVWVYRLVLFLGIAVLVYHFFIKAVGIVLFVVEIAWFVLRPLWSEARIWLALRREIAGRRRVWGAVAGLGGLVLLAALPWQDQVQAPAVLKALPVAEVHLPFAARLEAVLVVRGQRVEAGQPLMRFSAPTLDHRLAQVEARLSGLRADVAAAQVDGGLKERAGVLRQALDQAQAQAAALHAERARLTVVAPQAGVMADLAPDLHPGDWLSPRLRLGVVRGAEAAQAVAYVAEEDLGRVAVDAAGVFIPRALDHPRRPGRVERIDPGPSPVIADPALASVHGGAIPARQGGRDGGADGATLVPEGAVTRLYLHTEGPPPLQDLDGVVLIDGARRSLLGRMGRAALVVLVREWGL